MSYSLGAVVSVTGEKEYTESIKRIRTELKNLRSATAAETSAAQANGDTLGTLTSKMGGLRSAQKLQKDAVDAAREALERLKTQEDVSADAVDKMQRNLNALETEYNRTTVEINQLEKEMRDLAAAEQRVKDENAAAALKKMQENAAFCKTQMQGLASSAKAVVTAVAAIATATIGAVTATIKFAAAQGDVADELNTTATQMGISVDTLQKWQYAARFIDAEVATMQKGLAKVVKAMGTADAAGSSVINVADGLSVAIKGSNGELISSEDAFYATIDALGAMTNETQRETAAQALFGKSYQDLIPLIKAGSSALTAYGEEAEAVGAIIGTDSVAALQKFDDATESVDATWSAFKGELGAAIAEPLTAYSKKAQEAIQKLSTKLKSAGMQAAIEKIVEAVGKLASRLIDTAVNTIPKLATKIEWLVDHWDGLRKILVTVVAGLLAFKVSMAIGSVVATAVTALAAYKAACAAGTSAQTALNAACNANPWVLLISVVAALTVALVAFALEAKKGTAETQALKSEIDNTTASIDQMQESFAGSINDIDDTAAAAQGMVKTLEELQSKESLSASEKTKMKTIVDSLNGSYTGLNLKYDEEANSLNMSTDAVYAYIEARKKQLKQEAYSDLYTEALKEQATAQRLRDEAQANYREAYDYSRRWAGGDKVSLILPWDSAASEAAYAALEAAQENLVETTETVAYAEGLMDDAQVALSAGMTTTTDATDEQAYSLDDLNAAYEYAQQRVAAYSEYTQDAWNGIAQNATVSVDQMIQNLQDNQAKVAEYTTGLATLAANGLDSGILQELRDMGPAAADQVAAMVKHVDEGGSFDDLNELYQQGGQSAEQAVMSELDAIPDEALTVGESVGQSLADGIASKITAIYDSAYAAGDAANAGIRDSTDTHSPSRKGRWFGQMYGIGYAGGILDMKDQVAAATTALGSAAITGTAQIGSALTDLRGSSVSLPDAARASAQTVVNLTVTNPSESWTEWLFDKFNVRMAQEV